MSDRILLFYFDDQNYQTLQDPKWIICDNYFQD